MPQLDTPEYRTLVARVHMYGWRTGSRLSGCVTYTAYYRWRQLAELGVQPYATWIPRFRTDLERLK